MEIRMRSKVINLITRGDTETYEVIREALILYDEYLHSNKDIPKASSFCFIIYNYILRKIKAI